MRALLAVALLAACKQSQPEIVIPDDSVLFDLSEAQSLPDLVAPPDLSWTDLAGGVDIVQAADLSQPADFSWPGNGPECPPVPSCGSPPVVCCNRAPACIGGKCVSPTGGACNYSDLSKPLVTCAAGSCVNGHCV